MKQELQDSEIGTINGTEIWKDITGFEGLYQISNLGRVKSLSKSLILKPNVNDGGYYKFNLFKNGISHSFTVHQTVAVEFLNHKRSGFSKVVNHINGDKKDNRACNLELVTNRDNSSNCFKSNKNTKTSKYIGVSWHKGAKKWTSKILYKNKAIHLGSFDSEQLAHEQYQIALQNINNDTFDFYCCNIKPSCSSKYKHVSFCNRSQRWRAIVRSNNTTKYLGCFKTEIEAAQCVEDYQK